MKIVQINATCGTGSIGKICRAVSELLTVKGIENYILYTQGVSDYNLGINCGNPKDSKRYAIESRLLGNYGFNAKSNTERIIKELKRISPDVVHIHNIHSHDCNFSTLFRYLKENHIKVFYTFHDCWAFTGYCMYFDAVNCEKWKSTCCNCPQKKKFSWFFDRRSELQQLKKDALKDLDLTIITPSEWLAGLTRESFLGSYPIKVINNGIDLGIFKPTPSDFRTKYHIEDKFILLGIASRWEVRKGLDTFIKLSKQLDESYQIVLVGTTPELDKTLPSNIISIHRTEGQKQLAEIYTAADVLVNPTMEENFPTVNIESIACGTPVITYNTGGSAEMLDTNTGKVVEKGNFTSLLTTIKDTRTNYNFLSRDLLQRASMYAQYDRYMEYVNLYVSIRLRTSI